jgi:hypothetical protein
MGVRKRIRFVTDEMWARVDRRAGRLSMRTTAWCFVAVILAIPVGGAGTHLWRSGTFYPRLVADPSQTAFAYATAHGAGVVSFPLVNLSTGALEILGAGRDGPGLTLIRAEPAAPYRVAAGDRFAITLVYRVSHCGAVSAASWPVPVRVRTWRGEQTVYVTVPRAAEGRDAADPDTGDTPVPGPDVEWQRELADDACAMPA